MRRGIRIGIDVGRARVGVARCDPHAMLATPLETVARDQGGDADLDRICQLASEHEVFEAVVGLPINLRGERTASTEDAEGFAQRLAQRLQAQGIGVRLVDERLSTVTAQGQLHEAGRRSRQSRPVIDQAAAVVILQHAIDVERARGEAPGRLLPSTAASGEEHRA